jgi:hypothetical protein
MDSASDLEDPDDFGGTLATFIVKQQRLRDEWTREDAKIRENQTITIKGEFFGLGLSDLVGRTREEAVLFCDGKAQAVWLPLSLIACDEASGTVAMPEWLAKEKGLVY